MTEWVHEGIIIRIQDSHTYSSMLYKALLYPLAFSSELQEAGNIFIPISQRGALCSRPQGRGDRREHRTAMLGISSQSLSYHHL